MKNFFLYINEHIIIRETVGYSEFKKIPIQQLPDYLFLLRVAYNDLQLTNLK